MLALVLCAGVGSVVAEKVATNHSSAIAYRVGFLLMAVAMPALALAPSVVLLGVAMALYGLTVGMVDAANNMQGVALEHRYGRPIIQNFYATWTLGGIAGAVGALATHTLSFETSAVLLAIVPLAMVAAPFLKVAKPVVPLGEDGRKIPWKQIMPIGIALVLFYMAEMAVTTWGPTFVEKVFDAHGALIAVATLPYLAMSLVGRAVGDRLVGRIGPTRLIRGGTLLGAIGLAVVVFAPNTPVALLGFALLGVGVAAIAPLSFAAAAIIGRQAARTQEEIPQTVDAVIARFNQFNYIGAILGSVMTGAVSNSTLRWGFAIPMVLILAIIPLAQKFRSEA